MSTSGDKPRSDSQDTLFLPDFCAPGAVLAVVLISELVAVVLTLARVGVDADASFWADLARTSLFLLWIGLSSAAVLCYGRPLLEKLAVEKAAALALVLLLAVTGAISEVSWWLGVYWESIILPHEHGGGASRHGAYLLRNLLICLVVSALALRYFYVAHQWRRNVEMEATARVNALQARIRPHFLFNSMNTIAALTRKDPALAEEAVEDLADLFRASLRESESQLTLKEELEIARLYQRIEQLRLGDRLVVDWQVDALPMRALIPGLSLQPLLENAIYHGIEPLPNGGTVRIEGRLLEGDVIEIVMTNPIPGAGEAARRQGNRMALVNVRDRFEIAWGDRASVESGADDNEFRVALRFPQTEPGS